MADRALPFLILALAALGFHGVTPQDGGRFGPSAAYADDEDDEDDDDEGEDEDDDDDDDDDEPAQAEFVVAVPSAALLDDIAALGYVIVESERLELVDADVARIRPPTGVSLEAAQAQIATLSPQALVDLNSLYRPNALPCGPEGCAAFEMIGWGGRSCVEGAGPAPVIGMIDTTVNEKHPGLRPGAVETLAVLGDGRAPASAIHGTAIALLFAGSADSRTPGLLPQARLVAAEAFHTTGAGDVAADVFDIVRAMDLLAARDIDVLNMSFSGEANALLARAVGSLDDAGIPLAAAVGNGGPFAAPLYPAAYPATVAVTAVDSSQAVYRQANAGPHVDLAAPGVDLWTAASVSGGRPRSGTSYAVPFVSAALAVERVERPGSTPDQLQQALVARAVDLGEEGRDDVFGWGLVQMSRCVSPTEAGPDGAER